MNEAVIRMASGDDLSRIAAAYVRWGYGAGIAQEDTAWVAEMSGEIIGAVRVAPEHGTFVLRGMQVTERWRGTGIGARLLHAVDSWLDCRACYCIPYVHLKRFYGQIGFREIPVPSAPSFLAIRADSYKQRGLNVLVMMRGASPDAP